MKNRFLKYTLVPGIMSGLPRSVMDLICPSRLILPYYHMISDDQVDHTCNLYLHKNISEFKSDIEYLAARYEPVSLFDVMEEVTSGSGSMRRPSFHLTFDDGFREMHDVVAPILSSMGIPATFFVNSAYTDNRSMCHEQKASILAQKVKGSVSPATVDSVRAKLGKFSATEDLSAAIVNLPYSEKSVLDELAQIMEIGFDGYLASYRPYLDSDQISSLIDDGFTIGSHSIDHVPYGEIGLEEQIFQTVESTRWVRKTFGLDYGAFAFPYTDRYADRRFFPDVRSSGLVDVSFGTGGMVNGRISFHMNRFSLEKPLLPAHKIVHLQYARKAYGQLVHRPSEPGDQN